MEKGNATFLSSKKQIRLEEKVRQMSDKIEHLTAEECFEWITKIMYRAILFLGIPYFLFILFSFIRMTS
ncbi:hypothetical protein ACFP7A_09860 [Sporolactobacillus kofuensis]|uniref:Uncharacterized protein n=1 Tax=Sporolactobacillus kofuensis TaxID=269672 RepID=A0ABW1WH08_9BACL|nr:hypothetical protein [Sporolactobacillus kofuensis]MCO7176181.1 hypothetical protein [Sporolactobacillus kofuensis]